MIFHEGINKYYIRDGHFGLISGEDVVWVGSLLVMYSLPKGVELLKMNFA